MACVGALELTPEQKNLVRWLTALHSDDSATRYEALENLPEGHDLDVVEELIKTLNDADELIRLGAAEGLGRFRSPVSIQALREHILTETEGLVRAYCLSSLGLIGELKDLALLADESRVENSSEIRIHALQGLFELVRRHVTHELLDIISAYEDARALAVSALADSVLQRQEPEIVVRLEAVLAREKVPAWRQQIEELLYRLKEVLE